MEREAYFDMEKPLPQLGSGDYVQYIVQSNFIVQYRILEKGVYEFEEVSDEDEYEDYDESAYEEDAEDGVLDVETDENAETAEGVVSDEEI